jgi:hypothetical protein
VILMVITLGMAALSVALESFLLFLLAMGQAVVIFKFFGGSRRLAVAENVPSVGAALAGFRRHLPSAAQVHRAGSRTAIVAYRLLYRSAMCLVASLSAGLATLAVFVLKQAELWQWTTLRTAGPPLGALLVAALAALLALLVSACWASRWPLLPR